MYIFNHLLQAQDTDSSRLNLGLSNEGNLVLKYPNENIYCISLSQKCRTCLKIKSSLFFPTFSHKEAHFILAGYKIKIYW